MTSAQASIVDSGDYVLTGRPLRPGTNFAETSRFDDDTWVLQPALLQRHLKPGALCFATIPDHLRQAVKELCYALLAGELPPGEPRLAILSVIEVFNHLRRFTTWMQTDACTRNVFSEITAQDLLTYRRHLVNRDLAQGTQINARRAVNMLWRYRQQISDPLTIDPRHVEGWTLKRRHATENTTDRIPEQVLSPLITWAIRFVDDFSPDILAGQTALEQWRNRHRNGRCGRNSGLAEALEEYLREHVQTGRPLPGHRGKPFLKLIAFDIGSCKEGVSRSAQYKRMVSDAAHIVGVTNDVWLPVRVTGRIDDQPWTEGIAARHPMLSVETLIPLLQAACYIVIAYLSGMRDAEIKHLQRGCLSVSRDAKGAAYRWKLNGQAFKGESDPAGAQASWVVGYPAARAVNVLEALQGDNELLFATLTAGGHCRRDVRPGQTQATLATNNYMRMFITWVNDYCREYGRDDGIPEVSGKPWPISTRQFRRTLAWFIARRPGGSIAGAIQYRHLSIHMFEGYAGTSDSGFRAEVEAEQAMVRGEFLLNAADTHEHAGLAGPSGSEGHRRIAAFSERVRYSGIVVTDRHRLTRLLRQHEPAVYPGTFATCIFDATKALCVPREGNRSVSKPVLAGCQPLDCPNTAFTSDNLTALEVERDRLDDELAQMPELPPLLKHQLADRRDRIAAIIAHGTNESGLP